MWPLSTNYVAADSVNIDDGSCVKEGCWYEWADNTNALFNLIPDNVEIIDDGLDK